MTTIGAPAPALAGRHRLADLQRRFPLLQAAGQPAGRAGQGRRAGGGDAAGRALRSDIQDVLCDRVYAAGVNVRLGLTVRSVASGDRRARVEFSDGSAGDYDLVVGADGIRSAVRAMLGFASGPQPSGMSIWRVLADRPAELDCAEPVPR